MISHTKKNKKTPTILSSLEEKIKKGPDIDFDYLKVFNGVQNRISKEIQYIKEVFPEYTPHDEKNHVNNCFRIADEILGKKVISSLNVAELFLLVICLYSHDWGMAISPIQKKYILSNYLIKESEKKWLLTDERKKFLIYLKNQGIDISRKTNFDDLPSSYFQKYIRETHAERSGKRIFELLHDLDPNYSIGEPARAICIGHTLEFEQLEDRKNYPQQSSLLRETVNIRALTIYVRLIDLFDLSEDRTPYALWKFVAPEDVNSKMEWAKHRALRPITCPEKQGFKVILVNGDVYDHEVYAALEDLKKYCEDQLRRSNDLLIRMNIPNYNLEIRHIEWDVNVHGFEPINIRFEFDRNKMFDILSSEIYQNDPYVFLRELLQNSIDAIRLRRELVLKCQGLDTNNFGKIDVTVEHFSDGNSIITWIDDGIGMDEYIIKNYFSVAGRSYYRSLDFENLGLNIDPISKYGIGILSCFNISNRLEIITYKDPTVVPDSIPLKIEIPDVLRQFRIERIEKSLDKKIGTKITVFVNGSKIKRKNREIKRLNVTQYLKSIAGFVEFPILINEDSKKTAIFHPDEDRARLISYQKDGWTVYQYNIQLKYSDVFLPQDLQSAESLFNLKTWDIKKDLQVNGFEGKILFFIPKNEKIQLIQDLSSHYFGAKVISCNSGIKNEVIRWKKKWDEHDYLTEQDEKFEVFAVFNHGILLPNVEMPLELRGKFIHQINPRPKVFINLIGKKSSLIDISRLKLSSENRSWFEPISQAMVKKILKENNELITPKNEEIKWLKIGQILSTYPILFWRFAELFSVDRIQIPSLKENGRIEFNSLKKIIGKNLFEIPFPIVNLFEKNILEKFCKHEKNPCCYPNGMVMNVLQFDPVNIRYHRQRFTRLRNFQIFISKDIS
jgi:hypothetical protein